MANGSVPAEATAKRSQAIALSAQQVVALGQGIGDDGRDVTIQLFPDVSLTATLFAPVVAEPNRTVLRGIVKNRPESSVVIATRDGELFGMIRVGSVAYQLRGSGANAAAYEIDFSAFPPEEEPVDEAPLMRSMAARVLPAAAGDAIVDVMVLYTPKAKTEMGGDAAIKSMIDAAVEETNTAYANSGVTQRIRLVHAAETAYDEDDLGGQSTDSLFSLALSRLASTNDTYMENIHALRDQYNADLVSLIIKRTTTSCGIGRVGTPPRDTASFSVVDRTCTASNLSFAHELGHNMGLMHDRANAGTSTGLTPYAFGYQDPGGEFRTIMAYADGCGGFCPRVARFSNPDLTYLGKTTGVPTSDTAKSAYAALTLNESALMVANLRGQTTPPAQLTVADHSTSKGYNFDTEEAVSRSTSFLPTEDRVYASIRVANFIGIHSVQRRWYSPDGVLYASSASTVTGDGGTKNFNGNVAIKNQLAATKLGTWKVEWLLDSAIVVTDSFAIAEAVVNPGPCVANTNTLCLQGTRFAVTITGSFNGVSAAGQAVPINSQFGYFSIPGLTQDPNNAEILVKIAGPVSGKYWVFYGGISGFQVTITVRDTTTGVTKTYDKPVNTYNGGADFNSF
jgi:hypothetical protein